MKYSIWLAVGVVLALSSACGNAEKNASAEGATGSSAPLDGMVEVDGSSTVFPIMERAAEEFGRLEPGVRVPVGTSGTGGGFKKFGAGEIAMANASRPIKPEEIQLCKENNVEFVELPIAFDGISVVVNPQNTWAKSLTVEELRKIWQPNAKVKLWSDIRPEFPKEQINLFGAGTDSGTFDYFTKAVNGEEKASRPDYTASEDDNVLVGGIAGDKHALGYFGYAYFDQNRATLRALSIDSGEGPIAPSAESIGDGSYQPLSRPLFLYINRRALDRPEVMALAEWLCKNLQNFVSEVGYIPLKAESYAFALNRLKKRTPGSIFSGVNISETTFDEVLSQQTAK